jgi:hypothetical protein
LPRASLAPCSRSTTGRRAGGGASSSARC